MGHEPMSAVSGLKTDSDISGFTPRSQIISNKQASKRGVQTIMPIIKEESKMKPPLPPQSAQPKKWALDQMELQSEGGEREPIND